MIEGVATVVIVPSVLSNVSVTEAANVIGKRPAGSDVPGVPVVPLVLSEILKR